MTDIVLVQASRVISDAEVTGLLPLLAKWDELLRAPYVLDKAHFSFATMAQFLDGQTTGAWPIFINNHSADPGALGWHDATPDGSPFGRVFAGDCLRYHISWTVDLTHEIGEMRWNPKIDKFFTIPDGPFAGSITPQEVGDAVEDDRYAIIIDNLPFSNFVLPAFWSARKTGKFDYQGKLKGHAPSMLPGGYQSLYDDTRNWHQITARFLGGPPGWRSVRFDHSSRGRQLTAVPDHVITGSSPP